MIRWISLRVTFRKSLEPKLKYKINKYSSHFATVVFILSIMNIWFKDKVSSWDISTFLGLLTAGGVVALKDPIINIAGWLFILWRRPLKVGDRIQIGDLRGDVIDQRVFMFTVLEIGNWVDADQSTGRIIHIPNGKVFQENIANYTDAFEYIWNEIPILVTFESDWRKAKAILFDIAQKHGTQLTADAERRVLEASRKFMIFYKKLTPTVYTSVKDSGIMLTIRYITEPKQRRNTEQSIWEDILTEFEKHNEIDFAYPTTRFYTSAPTQSVQTPTEFKKS
jgi:small-conductance mechanosensitive channel